MLVIDFHLNTERQKIIDNGCKGIDTICKLNEFHEFLLNNLKWSIMRRG